MKVETKALEDFSSVYALASQYKLFDQSGLDRNVTGPHVHDSDGLKMTNFCASSYLGFDLLESIKSSAKSAIDEYGFEISTASSALTNKLYLESQMLLNKFFNGDILLSSSAINLHTRVIPNIIEEDAIVLIDKHVNKDIQLAVQLLSKNKICFISNNDMIALEDRLIEYHENNCRQIWYFADSINGMHGQNIDLEKLSSLLDEFHKFHLYIDDSHSIGWCGNKGKGLLNSRLLHSQKTVIAVDFSKSVGVPGASLNCRNDELVSSEKRTYFNHCLYESLQPGNLASLNQVVKLFRTEQVDLLKQEIKEKSLYFNRLCERYNIPLAFPNQGPIKFIAIGMHEVMYDLAKRLLDEKLLIDIVMYPSVTMLGGGLRCVINRSLDFSDLEKLVESIHRNMPLSFQSHNRKLSDVGILFRNYQLNSTFLKEYHNAKRHREKNRSDINFSHFNSIAAIKPDEWDHLFRTNGSYTWLGLKALQNIFHKDNLPENHWGFHYFIIRDNEKKIVIATFFTEVLIKQDIFSDAEVSTEIEKKFRSKEPYYLTSKVLMMGSLLTEGRHLYIDFNSPVWGKSLRYLLEQLTLIQQGKDISRLILRDFDVSDELPNETFRETGFMQREEQKLHVISGLQSFATAEDFLQASTNKKKRYQLRSVLHSTSEFQLDIYECQTPLDDQVSQRLFELYKNVATRSFQINTFLLPPAFFKVISRSPEWEILALSKMISGKNVLLGFAACHCTGLAYNLVLVGLDYQFNRTHGCYRQLLWQVIKRAKKLAIDNVRFGLTAATEKRRFGAQSISVCSYIR